MIHRPSLARGAVLAVTTALAWSCGGGTRQAGGLEVLIETNLASSAFNNLAVEVDQQDADGGWNKLFRQTDPVPAELQLPTRVSIQAGSSPDQVALITVSALLGSQLVVQSVAQVQVPTDRVGQITIFLSQTCVGVSCPASETCDPGTGGCVSSTVMSVVTYGQDGGSGEGGVTVTMGDGGPDGARESGTPTSSGLGGAASSASGGTTSSGMIAASSGSTGGVSSSSSSSSSGGKSSSTSSSSSSASSSSSSSTSGSGTTSSSSGAVTGGISGISSSSSSGSSGAWSSSSSGGVSSTSSSSSGVKASSNGVMSLDGGL